MIEPTRLFMVRHGQTNLNKEKRFRGITDAPLNETGRRQVCRAGSVLQDTDISVVHVSPLPRAVQTGEIIADMIGADVVVNRGLMDIDYGQWQGLTVEEVAEKFGPEALEQWVKEPGGFSFPDGEGMKDVRDRLEPVLVDMVEEDPGGSVAAVSHMALLKVSFLITLGLGFDWFWKIAIDPGSVSCFTYENERGFVLDSWNIPPELSSQ